MSTKGTIIYAESKDFEIHLYYCFVKGYAIDIRYKEFNTTCLIDEEQAKQLEKQMREM
jgi:hypothetical protein